MTPLNRVLNLINFSYVEQYELAVEDFTKCLEHYTKTLEDKFDRRIAEINYNIGLAYSFDKKFEEAIVSFKKAKDILESRLEMLKSKVEKQQAASGKEKASVEFNDWVKEIKELEDLVLLDMNAKVNLTLTSYYSNFTVYFLCFILLFCSFCSASTAIHTVLVRALCKFKSSKKNLIKKLGPR